MTPRRPTTEQLAAIAQANAVIARGQKDLVAAAQHAFPVGARVRVEIGGHTIDGIVTGHDEGPMYAGYVHVENGKTGKRRKFCAGFHQAEVL